MVDYRFYKNFGPFDVKSIIHNLECDYIGNENKIVKDISTLKEAGHSDLSFFSNIKYLNDYKHSKAGVIIVSKKYVSERQNCIISKNPLYTFAEISQKFYPNHIYPNFFYSQNQLKKKFKDCSKVSLNCFVHETASLGSNVCLGLNSIIGPNVSIGDNCVVGDNVSIYFSQIKNNVKISSGVKIGTEGFGFAIGEKKFMKLPQLGRVLINNNVEIGANSTIDRGSCGDTVIGENVMIDNLVHIAHNVEIGRNTIIAAMTGISGSVKVGKHVIIGGQVGISGHLIIGDKVKIAAKSGVINDISDNKSVGGYPAESIKNWHRSTIYLRKNVRKKL